MATGGEYLYSIGINVDSLKRGVDRAKNEFLGLRNTAVDAGSDIDDMFNKIKGSLAGVASAVALKELAQKIIDVRGEVQQLEVAFETMLGSKQRADALMAQVVGLAAKTPFGLQEVSNATKMLLAYGSTAEEVAEEIKMLGNIASGLSIPLNDIIYLYGTTRTQGRMFTQDLRQFMGRGIPLAEELAKIFGVTKAEVGDLVSEGKVGFEEMAQALSNMTSEGGQFASLMEKQSQTIAGQISNLGDAVYQMFNQIGQQNEGVISDIISGAAWVVEHYQSVLNILKTVVVAYGSYKAAIIAVAATQKALAIAKSAKAFFELAKGITSAKEAMLLLNVATGANPFALIISAVVALGAAFLMTKDNADRLREAEERYAEVKDAIIAKEDEHKRKIDELAEAAGDESRATEDRRRALVALEIQYPAIFAKYDTEAEKLANIKRIKGEIAALDAKGSIANPENELASVEKRIEELKEKERPKTTYSRSLGITPTGGGLSNEEKAELKNLQNRREELKSQIFDNYVTDIVAGVENLSDGLLTSTLQQLKAEQSRRNRVSSNNYGYSVMGGNSLVEDLTSTNVFTGWTDDQIQAYIQRIEGEKSARQQKKYTAAELKAQAMAELKAARKALEDFDKAEFKGSEQELIAQREALKAAVTAAEDKAKKLGANTKKGNGGVGSERKTRETEAKRNAEQAAALEQQLVQQNVDAEVSLMQEGTEKKLKQIDVDYDKRIAAIQKNEDDLKKLQNGLLTDAQQGELDKSRQLAEQQRDAERKKVIDESAAAELRAMDEYLIKFGTLQEKIRATKSKYERDIAEALTEGERKTLEAERDAALAELELQAMGFAKTLTNKSIGELNKMLKDLEAQVQAKEEAFAALETSDSEEAQEYLKIINELKAKIAELKQRLGEAGKEVKDSNWTGAAQVLQGISSAASTAASSLRDVDEGLAGALSTIAEFTSVVGSLVSAIAMIAAMGGTLNTVLGVIGLIAAAVQVVGLIAGKIAGVNKEYEQTIENFKALNRELEQMHELAKIDALDGTIFGKDAFGNFANNLNVMREAAEKLQDSTEGAIKRTNELKRQSYEMMLARVAGVDQMAEAYWRQKLAELDEVTDLMSFIGAMEVSLGKNEKSNLAEQLPELFAAGEITLEGLQALKNSDIWEKLKQADRDLIDDMIADWEVFEKATESVNEYLTDVFGELGNSINDAIVDAFTNGTDAALAFGDIAGEVIENLIKQVGYSAYIAPILTQAMADVEALNGQGLSAEEYLNALMGIVGKAMSAAEGAVEGYNEFLENADQYAESKGLNTFDSERSAQRKGIAQASQDSVDELNGRMTAIQGHTYSLVAGQRQLINDTAQVLRHLAGIESNTAELRQIRQDMSAMRSDISDIATRGIITR